MTGPAARQTPAGPLRSREITDLRLRNQRLAAAPLAGVAEVVHWLGAVQVQEYPVARWSIGQRSTGLTAANVDAALAGAEVIRTHVLRDTWHLVTADDVRWLLDLTAPRIQRRNATMYRRVELEPPLLARTNAVLADVLAGGRQLTRKALGSALTGRGIVADGFRLSYILMHAELTQLICSGARDGRQHTYALLDERVPRGRSRSRDEALGEIVRRFFTSHGPATVKDFTWWSSLTVADATRGLEIARDELEHSVVGDRHYWSGAPVAGIEAPRAHLVQAYDEYVIAYRESRDIVDVAGLAAVVPDGQTMFAHTVLLDGQVLGHWRRGAATGPSIELQLARSFDQDERNALDDAILRYSAFMAPPSVLQG